MSSGEIRDRLDADGGVPVSICGDGIRGQLSTSESDETHVREACDDGNVDSGDGCSADCQTIEPYYMCPTAGEPCERVPFDEVLEAGLDRHVGTFETPRAEVDGDETHYTWGGEGGPRCLSGGFVMSTREGSEDLIILMGGGGLCTSDLPIYGRPLLGPIVRQLLPNGLCNATTDRGVNTDGVMDTNNPDNPFAGWSAARIGNCDGSVFVGDSDDRPGLINLTASLEAIRAQFPNARRVALVGTSAGAYGLAPAVPLVRSFFPDSPLFVVADSGLGVGDPDDPGFVDRLLEDLNIDHLAAAACDVADEYTDCEQPNEAHLTWLYDYALREDPNLTIAGITTYEDIIIGGFFLDLARTHSTGALGIPYPDFNVNRYRRAMGDAVDEVHDAHPGRFETYQYEGFGHVVTTYGDIVDNDVVRTLRAVADFFRLEIFALDPYRLRRGGVRLMDWLQAMLDGSDEFKTMRE